jgi:hypothetical protein
MTYQDVIACRLNNHYKASKKRLFELFYYRIYGYSVSTEQSKRSAIPVALLPRLSFWAIVARRHDRHPLRRQGDGPPVVSPRSKLILMACKRSRSARRRSSLPNFPRRKSINHGKRGMTRKGKSYSPPKNRMPYAGPFTWRQPGESRLRSRSRRIFSRAASLCWSTWRTLSAAAISSSIWWATRAGLGRSRSTCGCGPCVRHRAIRYPGVEDRRPRHADSSHPGGSVSSLASAANLCLTFSKMDGWPARSLSTASSSSRISASIRSRCS